MFKCNITLHSRMEKQRDRPRILYEVLNIKIPKQKYITNKVSEILNKINNEEIRKELEFESITRKIIKRRWQYKQHFLRTEESIIAKAVLENSLLLPSWRAVRSYRPHLEERDPIWGDDWSHSPFIRRSPNWGFLGFSSAVRQMPGDLCTAPRTI